MILFGPSCLSDSVETEISTRTPRHQEFPRFCGGVCGFPGWRQTPNSIHCIVSDLSDYVNFRLYRGAQMGILHRENAAGQQICAHLCLREADGANPQSGRLTQETSSPPSSARDAAAIGGAREGMPRQSRIFRIASRGLIAARILMRHVAMRIVRAHLATMARINVRYDLLPRESEILRLHFWDRAFELLKERGAIYHVDSGRNRGCWVMRTNGEAGGPDEGS